MILSSIPSNTASAITPFNPLGKQAVGEEANEKGAKNSSFKAVEESSQSQRNTLRQDSETGKEKIDAIADEDQSDEQNQREDDSQQGDNESGDAREERRLETLKQEAIGELARRDREVRNHERAHAAIAPVDSSPQDGRVAANASQIELDARHELVELRRREVEQEQRADTENQQELKSETRAVERPKDDQSDSNVAKERRQINAETNRRIITLNQNYLDLSNQSSRLGSIVSEAV